MSRNLALYLALRLASGIVPRLPLELCYRLATFIGNCAYLLLPGPRAAIGANLARVMNLPRESDEVKTKARQAFQNDAKNWIDTLRISTVSDEDIVNSAEVEGWEHMEAAVRGGKGVIIVAMHLGNFDLVGQYVAIRGGRLTIPVERMQPERLSAFLLELRRSKGINVVPMDQAPREIVKALKAAEIVAIMTDRNVAGRGIRVEFFGAETLLPRAPVSLARHTGAPLLVCGAVRMPGERFLGFVSAPVATVRSDNPARDDQDNLRRLATIMEEYIGRFPEQWLMFTPLWKDRTDANLTGTIEQRKEAAV
jgi:lauroyl/myristoyl acyltransferase